jgi:HK97 family phage major capsid protein
MSPGDDHRAAASQLGMDINNRLLEFDLAPRALRSLDREDVREWEERTMSTTTGSQGGYVVPDETMRSLETAMLRFGGMRQVADIIRTDSGAALPWPTMNDTTNTGEIIGQNGQVSNQDLAFSQLVLNAFKYSSKMILIPVELLQDSAVNLADVVGTALGQRIGRISNTHFTTGAGTTVPWGIVTRATLGKTGASGQTTSVTTDDLVDLEHSVDPDYRVNARWMFADSTLKALKKLKSTSTDLPLWLPGIAVKEPDTILGYPYVINQAVAAMAASAKSIVFGDLSKYKIRDVRQVQLLRLDERFADYHQVAFLAFSRHDGDLLDAGTHPVKYYANAAS